MANALTQDRPTTELSPHERYVPKPFFGSSHWWASRELENLSPQSTVLDVGAGSGVMGQALKERGFSELYAIEPSEVAREYVRPIYKRAESSLSSFKNLQFDCVLMLDVLEHMAEPFDFLSELASLVKPGATILISVPNIVHWSVRALVLFGHFDYTARGPLDYTHLRFFTRRSISELVERNLSFRIEKMEASISPAELVIPSSFHDSSIFKAFCRLRYKAAQVLPGIGAYQTLLRVTKVS